MDLSSARITLYRTPRGLPRGVPINRAVHDALIALGSDPVQRTAYRSANARTGPAEQILRAFESAVTNAGIKGFRFPSCAIRPRATW